MKKLPLLGSVLSLSLVVCPGAFALSLNDPGVVGTITDGAPSSIADEMNYINTLLGLGADVTQTIDGELYKTSSTDYNGSVTDAGAVKMNADDPGFVLTVSGYSYVIAKYDGQNGGSVVWYLNGGTMTLPSDSEGLWVNTAGNGYGISHWTGFGGEPGRSVPDAGSTLTLIGAALTGLAFVRRKVSR